MGSPPLVVLATGPSSFLPGPSHLLNTPHLFQVEPHVMTEDVERGLGASTLRPVAFDPRGLEKSWVAELVAGGEDVPGAASLQAPTWPASFYPAPRMPAHE